MVRVEQEFERRDFLERGLDGGHVLAWRKACAIGDAEDMRIDRYRVMPERRIEHHIGGLAAYPWQRFERFAVRRNFAPVPLYQQLAGADNILRLVAKQTYRLDVFRYASFAQFDHGLRRIGRCEQAARRLVDGHVGGLRGKQDGDQQFKRRVVFEFGRRMRIETLQRLVDGAAFFSVHRRRLFPGFPGVQDGSLVLGAFGGTF